MGPEGRRNTEPAKWIETLAKSFTFLFARRDKAFRWPIGKRQ
jgi:hypothetical protein